jgi:hypothetical protein
MDGSSKIPSSSDDRQDPMCPTCGEPLTSPQQGQTFTPIEIPTIEPSKVCETCKVGYWLSNAGWLVVATIDSQPHPHSGSSR